MSSFDDYVQAHLPSLLRLAGVLSRDRQTSEDVVQEVLFRASVRWDQINAAGVPDAYVRRMVVNEYLSWRRKWARLIPHAAIDTGGVEPDHGQQVAERDEMEARLRILPAGRRAVLVLRYYEGLGDDQIADVLGCSNGAVRTAASRALATLRVNADEDLLLDRKDH